LREWAYWLDRHHIRASFGRPPTDAQIRTVPGIQASLTNITVEPASETRSNSRVAGSSGSFLGQWQYPREDSRTNDLGPNRSWILGARTVAASGRQIQSGGHRRAVVGAVPTITGWPTTHKPHLFFVLSPISVPSEMTIVQPFRYPGCRVSRWQLSWWI
jgi:hypothetical protein